MADQTQIAAELYSWAKALVRKLRPRQHGWNEQDIEDAVQLLFLAGWQDYRDNGDLGLAKNRMADRRKNLLRDRKARLAREAVLESNLPEPEEGQPAPLEQCRLRGNRRDDPVELAAYNELLARLPERQRQIVLLKMSGLTDAEVDQEIGVSKTTIERELRQFRKDHADDHDD
jgi:DNA-directed RNA polymerase specialized sigma24 family protein